jgi:UDP-N-acetylmuramoylalanine--D-glutamate ligase
LSERFDGARVLVVGAGVAGLAAATALQRQGADVRVTESRPAEEIANRGELRAMGVQVLAGGHEPAHLEGATLVVTGPGIPEHAPVLEWARDRGIPVWGEMELGARLCDVPYVAVTGTNGKTTVTGMVASCLRAAGLDAVACGNIGHAFPLAALEEHDALVVECSSFQLRLQTSLHPKVSVLLNLAPDHLDWHGSFEGYAASKASIYANQGADDVHVGSLDDPRAAAISSAAPCPVVWTSTRDPDEGEVGIVDGVVVSRVVGSEGSVGPVDADRAGFAADAAAAAAAALSFGVDADAVRAGLASFQPQAHRGEVIATVDGVPFIDNSKATNVHAAMAAIERVRHAVLIAGGRAKGVDLSPLAEAAPNLSAVVAIGEAAPELLALFEGIVPASGADSIEAATARAFDLARTHGGPVLLAPACASWDQFTGYAERGDRFAAAARSLQEVAARGGA